MPDAIVTVTEIYVDGQLVDKQAKVVKDPPDYVAWAIGLVIAVIGLWVMAIPMEPWGFFK